MASGARKHNSKGRSTKGPPFIQLYRHVKRSQAFRELSPYARCALIELLDRYNGANNGEIALGIRELSAELQCNPRTARKALQELDDSGLARPTRMGGFRRGGNFASEWRLMFYRDDRNGDLPVRNWPAASQCTTYTAPVAPRTLRKCEKTASSAPRTLPDGENSQIRSAPRTTHVESNHGGTPVSRRSECAPASEASAAGGRTCDDAERLAILNELKATLG